MQAKKTYILAGDGYFDDPYMHKFVGTFRELLYHVLSLTDEDEEGYEDDGHFTEMRAKSDEDLIAHFNEGNGDGQSYVQVFCLEDDKKVLG